MAAFDRFLKERRRKVERIQWNLDKDTIAVWFDLKNKQIKIDNFNLS